MKYEFRLQTNSRDELEKVTALLRRVWPKNRRFNLAYIEWLYRDNPDGQAIGYNAFYGDEVAAHYVVIPFQAEIEGEQRTSALAVHAAVDERHRGRSLLSPFHRLAKMTQRRALELGVDHIVGVANANSTLGFVRHLGFQLVTPLDVRMCLTLPSPSGERIEWQWRRKWSAEALAWRIKNPGGSYWIAKEGDVSWILGATKYRGVRGLLKVESDPALATQVSRFLPRRSTWPPILWFGLRRDLSFPAAFNVPMRVRPSPFNLIYLDLGSRRVRLMPERVHFEAADFDVM